LTSCSSKSIREEKYENGNPKEKYQVVEKKDGSFIKDGYYKTWHENGQIELSGDYNDNKKVGKWKSYYSTGKIEEEGKYENGQKQDIWKTFAENGQILSEFLYKSGEMDGLQKSWYSSGQKKCEQNFTNGKANGKLLIWDKEGKIKGDYEYEYGKNLSLNGDYYHNFSDDSLRTSDLIWSFTSDGIAKRQYISQPVIFELPFQLINCSIIEDIENIKININKSYEYEILFGNNKELRIKDASYVVVLSKIVK
jgi:antitoxin component YwqK of YwqJK toxin-antitoxin module